MGGRQSAPPGGFREKLLLPYHFGGNILQVLVLPFHCLQEVSLEERGCAASRSTPGRPPRAQAVTCSPQP